MNKLQKIAQIEFLWSKKERRDATSERARLIRAGVVTPRKEQPRG